jgi:predicted DNA-binding transcriptional regulator YafY
MKILLEETDEQNMLTAQELIDRLAAYDVNSERKSLYNDIDLLVKFGIDIKHQGGRNAGYYVASWDFELAELKLLVDAVQSSRLITGKKSRTLIGKLSKLTSLEQAKQLNRQVLVNGRAKALNETVYYSIDAIHAAINYGKKISFKYFDYNVKKNRVYRKNEQIYVRTPVAMCWNDDNYYLITYNPKYDDPFATFRVDRMTSVEIISESADNFDRKKFSISDYIKQTFGMFSGEIVSAELAFDESLVSVVLDHFGSDTSLTEMDGGRFAISAEVSASPVFLSWIFQFGNRAEILSPDTLRAAMRGLVTEVQDVYGE